MAANLQLVITAVDKASGPIAHINNQAGGLTSGLKKVGAIGGVAMVAGLGVAGAAAIKFIGVANNLNEVTNKSNVVFANSAKAVQDFAASAARSFGIAKVDALEYASTLGVILKGSGLSESATADMSVKLTQLAADMASFNNIPIGVALEKIRAGLVGESEPLRTVGVLLSEAAVKTKAYEMGLAAAGAELTDQQKVQARYALILAQTTDQQGDFARTSDSLANRTRILGAQWKNIQATLGNALLPIVTQLAITFSNFLTEHEDDINRIVIAISDWASTDGWRIIERAMTQLQQLIKGIMDTGIIQWLADHKIAVIALGAALLLLVVAFGGPLLIIPALIAAGTLLLANWDQIRAKIDEIVTDFQTKFPVLVQIIEFVFGYIKARVDFWIAEVRAVIRIVTALIHGDFREAWQGIKDMVNGFLNLIKADVENVLRLIVGVVKSVLPDDLIAKPFNLARQSVKWLIDKINDLIDIIKKIPTPGDIFGGIGGAIGGIVPFQHGGIVTKPTLALLAERGQPEAVIPLNQMSNVAPAPGLSPAAIGAAVREALEGMHLTGYLDPDGVLHLISGAAGRQANLYSRGG